MSTNNVRQRLRSYLDDGLMEMAMGAAVIAFGATLLLHDLIYMAWLFPWLFMAVLLPATKKKVIAPRGGVVEFPKLAQRGRFLLVMGLTVLATLGLVVATAGYSDAIWFRPILAAIEWSAGHFALVLGPAFALILAMLGLQGMTPYLVWLAGLSLVAGLLADLLIPGGRVGAVATGFAVGVPLLITGYINYRRFVDTHPPLLDASQAA